MAAVDKIATVVDEPITYEGLGIDVAYVAVGGHDSYVAIEADGIFELPRNGREGHPDEYDFGTAAELPGNDLRQPRIQRLVILAVFVGDVARPQFAKMLRRGYAWHSEETTDPEILLFCHGVGVVDELQQVAVHSKQVEPLSQAPSAVEHRTMP